MRRSETRPPEIRCPNIRRLALPSIALALVLSVLEGGTAAADMVAGRRLMPPRVPQAAPPPPPAEPAVVPAARPREAPPPRPRPATPAPARQAAPPPPSDGKVR